MTEAGGWPYWRIVVLAALDAVAAKVQGMVTHEFIDSYEQGTTWLAVDQAEVLAAIEEVRRDVS